MRQRPSLLLYCVTLVSGGIFIPIWLGMMVADIGKSFPGKLPYAKRLAILYSVALIAIFVLAIIRAMFSQHYFSLASGVLIILFLVCWAVMIWSFFALVFQIHQFTVGKSSVAGQMKIILLTLLAFSSLPYLQRGLNRIAQNGLVN
jgi:hypothetical protein